MLRHIRKLMSLSVAAHVALLPAASSACGYHDDVTMARGLLNWIYPDALHVLGSISAAVAASQLPNPNLVASSPDMFGAKYNRTIQSLKQFSGGLATAPDEMHASSIALVLVEPMLWTRFERSDGKLLTRMHVTGPAPGDLVLVSGEAVISEIAEGRLTIGKAHRLGVIRLYGTAAQQAQFLLAYGGPPAAGLAGNNRFQPAAHPVPAPMTPITTTGSTPRISARAKNDERRGGPGHD